MEPRPGEPHVHGDAHFEAEVRGGQRAQEFRLDFPEEDGGHHGGDGGSVQGLDGGVQRPVFQVAGGECRGQLGRCQGGEEGGGGCRGGSGHSQRHLDEYVDHGGGWESQQDVEVQKEFSVGAIISIRM